jgi:hypothetical protein
MPIFSNEPPPDSDRPGFPLTRTPAAHAFLGIITSDDLVGCPTHFYRNRTMPCDGEGCEPCHKGYTWRWHGYFSCVDQSNHEHVIFEVTATASDPLREYRKLNDTLRGCLFKAARRGHKYNGRVIIICKPADLAGVLLPAAPNIPKILCHIWNIPSNEATVVGRSHGHPQVITTPADGDGRPRR